MSVEALMFPESDHGNVAGLEKIGELGRGTSTVVWRARRQGVEYALKVPTEPVPYGDEGLSPFVEKQRCWRA